jgi:hypothetical protein
MGVQMKRMHLMHLSHTLLWSSRTMDREMGFNPPAAPGGLILILGGQPLVSFAQPVALSPTQLDQLVERIALYPDPSWQIYSPLRPTGARFLKLHPGQISTAI